MFHDQKFLIVLKFTIENEQRLYSLHIVYVDLASFEYYDPIKKKKKEKKKKELFKHSFQASVKYIYIFFIEILLLTVSQVF